MTGQDAGGLTARFRRLIADSGPISLAHYMAEANAHYYSTRDPFGAAGDFITAPEISQMFGELIGLWLADLWIKAGRPEPVHYVELGPGRGTLARDAMRGIKRHGLEPKVHFVEGSAALKRIQLETVPDAVWHHDLTSVPDEGTVLIVANEFLDALPVRQLVKTEAGWRERMIATDEDGAFICIAGEQPMDAALPEARRGEPEGTLIETSPAAAAIIHEVARRLSAQGGAALFIDYGHDALRTGSTFQAVRAHQKVDPFTSPGEADLTAHVDFPTLSALAESLGAKWLGTVPQGAWLRALGIESRAEALAASSPHHRAALMAARDRLIADSEMGLLFKVMGLAAPNWPDGVGF